MGVDKAKMKNFLCLVKWGQKWVKITMLFIQHGFPSWTICSQMVLYLFSISKHAQQDPLQMEVFKRKENPRRFMRNSWTRKCYHARTEFISASRLIQSCATVLTEEWEANSMSQHCLVPGLENNHIQIHCVRSLWSLVLPFWHPVYLSSFFSSLKALSLKLDSVRQL